MKSSSPHTSSPNLAEPVVTAPGAVAPATHIAAAGARPTLVRYWVLAILCLAATIAYMQRYSINVLTLRIGPELNLNKDQMGSVMAGFFVVYGLMQVPAGWLADRWGSRRALSMYAALWSVCTALMALAYDQFTLIAIWSIMGAAQAGLFPSAIVAIRQWLPGTQRAFASGLLASCMSFGGVLAPVVTGALLYQANLSWQTVFAILAVPGLGWAALYYLWFRDRPAEHQRANQAERELLQNANPEAPTADGVRSPLPWAVLLTSLPMWLICWQQFFRAAAQVFFGTWFASFLADSFRADSPGTTEEAQAAWLASLPLAVLIIGSTTGGIISDWLLARTGSRRIARQGLTVVNMLITAALFTAAALAADPYARVALISIACFSMALGGVSSYAITMDMGGAHVATVFSLMNMSGSAGAAVFPKYAGWLVETTGNWDFVLFSIAGIYLAAGACWLLLNPNGTIFDKAVKS